MSINKVGFSRTVSRFACVEVWRGIVVLVFWGFFCLGCFVAVLFFFSLTFTVWWENCGQLRCVVCQEEVILTKCDKSVTSLLESFL